MTNNTAGFNCSSCGPLSEPHIRPPSIIYRSYCSASIAPYIPSTEFKYKGRTYTCGCSIWGFYYFTDYGLQLRYKDISRATDIRPYLSDQFSGKPLNWWQAQCALRDLDPSGTIEELKVRLQKPGGWQLAEFQKLHNVKPTRETAIERLEQQKCRDWVRRNDAERAKLWLALSPEERIARDPSKAIKEKLGIEIDGKRHVRSWKSQKFSLFKKLPPEIRAMIWKFAMPNSGAVVVLDKVPFHGWTPDYDLRIWQERIQRTVDCYGLTYVITEPHESRDGMYLRLHESIWIEDDVDFDSDYDSDFDSNGFNRTKSSTLVFSGTGFKEQVLIAATYWAIRQKTEKMCDEIAKELNLTPDQGKPDYHKNASAGSHATSTFVEYNEDDFSDDEHIRVSTSLGFDEDDFSDDEHILASISS